MKALRSDAECLSRMRPAGLLVEGHCDERGTTEYNIALGARRADAVRKYLADLGMKTRFDTVSFGKELPVAQGSARRRGAEPPRRAPAPRRQALRRPARRRASRDVRRTASGPGPVQVQDRTGPGAALGSRRREPRLSRIAAPPPPAPIVATAIVLYRDEPSGREVLLVPPRRRAPVRGRLPRVPGGRLDPEDAQVPVAGASGDDAALVACATRRTLRGDRGPPRPRSRARLPGGPRDRSRSAPRRRAPLGRPAPRARASLDAAPLAPAGRWVTPSTCPSATTRGCSRS